MVDWVLAIAASPWVLVVIYLFATIDGFFPPIPSETVVIGVAALAVHGAPTHLIGIAFAAAAGALTGDVIAYTIGSRIPVRRLRPFRSGRGLAALDRAEHALEHRGASFIIAARYIPVGRIAVNMTAGAIGFPRTRFVPVAAVAGLTWGLYATALGAGSGAWLQDHPLLGVVVGVVAGILIGLVVDPVVTAVTGRRRRGAAGGAQGTAVTDAAAGPAAPRDPGPS